MKILLFFLLFLVIVFVLGYALRKEILIRFCGYIKKKTGFVVRMSSIGLSLKGLYFKQLIINRAAIHLEIDVIHIGLSLQTPFFAVQIGNLNCYRQRISEHSIPHQPKHNEKTTQSLFKNILENINRLLRREYPKIARYMGVKIHHLQVFLKNETAAILSIDHLIFSKQQIGFELNNFVGLQSTYLIRLWFNRHQILYAVTHLQLNHIDHLQAPRIKGKIAIAHPQQLTLSAYASTVILNHQKIANQALTLKNINLLLMIDQFEDRIELNPDSSIQFNNMTLDMKGRYNDEDGFCSLLVYLSTKVEDLINLIPKPQVRSLPNFKSEGQICVGISLGFLWSDPLHYKFNLDYDTEDFKIINPGITLSYLNNDFDFKSIINPAQPCLLKVSGANDTTENQPLLAKIIQLAEDPNFYQHHGVDSYFVGIAIANNLAKRQFFKGASTISMQLIKNLYLGEEKSLARKLEELILTLLMENHFQIPKSRILAIYLQLIELGPEIYGVDKAAKFYFNKTVNELTVLECLVMSYIIPRPRFFLAALKEKSEQLDRNLSKHIDSKLRMLIANRIITRDELLHIGQKIEFYTIGEFELSHLNIAHLTTLPKQVNNLSE